MAVLRIGKWKVMSNVGLRAHAANDETIVIQPDGGGTVSIVNGIIRQQGVPLTSWVTINAQRVAGRWPSVEEVEACEQRSNHSGVNQDAGAAPYRKSKHATKKVGAARKKPKRRHSTPQWWGRRH